MVQNSDQGAAAMDSAPGGDVAAPRAAAAAAPVMTVGGVLTVAGFLLVFALIALALVFIQYCYFNPRRSSSPATAAVRSARGRQRGVDPEVLRSLPVTVYRAAKGSAEEDGVDCAVCLAGLEDGEEARFLPRCGHGFHAECVDLWLASHSTCPLCRLAVGKPDVSPAALPAVPAERPATMAVNVNLPASVLADQQGALAAVPVDTGGAAPSPAATMITIEIPESSAPAAATPRGVATKSPGSARLRSYSFRRLWSFGRQAPAGPGTTPSCSCNDDEEVDAEQSISLTVGVRPVQAPPPPPGPAPGATTRTAE